MSRVSLSFTTEDLSAFAEALGGELRDLGRAPSHLELLNMLARAGGRRNYQHLRAQGAAQAAIVARPALEPAVDYVRLRRTLRLFDAAGRLTRWPPKLWERELVLWALWAGVPPRAALAEKAVNAWLGERHGFADPALLRRWLVDLGFVTRNPDGSAYRRVERRPPPQARALIAALGGRSGAPQTGA